MSPHPSFSSAASSRSIHRAVCALIVCVSFAAAAQEPTGPSPFGSSSALLFYNAASGEGATARLDSAGTYGFVGSIPGFAKGWTHITGTANGGLLFYNASTGDGATARIDSAGTYTFVSSIPGFARGWTHIAGF